MIKISYRKENSKETGTAYSQTIRATGKDAGNLAHILQEEAEKAEQIQKTKTRYTSAEMQKIYYQKPPAKTESEILKGGAIKFFLNLTQLKSIWQYINSPRLLLRNSILILGGV